MTDIEQLADKLYYSLDALEPDEEYPAIMQALTTAYTIGKHDAYAGQRTAARENGKSGGRPKGSKDKSSQPRTRRSKAEIAQEVKP